MPVTSREFAVVEPAAAIRVVWGVRSPVVTRLTMWLGLADVTNRNARESALALRKPKTGSPILSALAVVTVPATLAVASAFLMSVAIATPRFAWLGWVTLIPLLFALRSSTPTGAAAFGAVWGSALFGFGAFVLPTPIAPSLGSWALLTGIPALYAFAGARLTLRVGYSPLLLALGWIGVELALHPLGLQHGLLAGTQGDGVLLHLVGSYAGYALVAFLVVYVNAWLLTALAAVPIPIPGRRLVRATGERVIRLATVEIPNYWFLLLRPSKPRAPPRVALA